MRILYHHRTLGDGAEGIHVAEIVKALRRLGHEVRVVSLIGEETNIVSHRQQTWSAIAKLIPGFTYELAEIAYNIKGYQQVSRVVREFCPDAIYDRHASYNYSCIAVARRANIPVLLEVNAPYSYEKSAYERLYFRQLLTYLEIKTCCAASRVLVVSSPLKDYLRAQGVPGEKIEVMPNGVDPEVFSPATSDEYVRRRYDLRDRCVIGFVGILRPWHGLELLFDAFAHIDHEAYNLHLLIVGDGPSEQALRSLSQKLHIADRITFTGRVEHNTIRSYIAAFNIAVSPRATFYASPMKILEYMAMAKATIAPDMPNIRDIIANGVDGVLFELESKEALCQTLKKIISDHKLRHTLGINARKKIERSLTWKHNAQRIVDVIQTLQEKALASRVD
jgi:glycosyltransferase involved in cell wall biosynthesis